MRSIIYSHMQLVVEQVPVAMVAQVRRRHLAWVVLVCRRQLLARPFSMVAAVAAADTVYGPIPRPCRRHSRVVQVELAAVVPAVARLR